MSTARRAGHSPAVIASLARRIGNAVGFSFPPNESTAASEFLKSDGAWEYHFETDERWGFVTPGVETYIQTTYPGWGTVTIGPRYWAVFYCGTLVGVVSSDGGRIRWYAPPIRDEYPSDLGSAMHDAFTAELDEVLPSISLWIDPKGDSYPFIGEGGE